MFFTDVYFLFYFLPAVLIIHRLLAGRGEGGRYSNAPRLFLFLATLYFYGYKEPWWLVPFFISIGFDFLWASLLEKTDDEKRRFRLLTLSIVQNLGLLFAFKYYHAFSGLIAQISPRLATWLPNLIQDSQPLPMPAGISFYTFESLSFVIDVYRRQIRAPKNPLEFFGFIGMFPRFIAGPIVRYKDMVGQFAKYSGANLERGLLMFAWGFCLKAGFADSFATFIPYAFTGNPGFSAAWLGVFMYALQIYFDFSGYTLMALGIGLALGFQFPPNFETPYHSSSITEFWRRWHMSLGAWVKDYVFTPMALYLGRRSPKYLYLVTFLTMTILGAWHGASFNFVLFGAWHGLLMCFEMKFQPPRYLKPHLAKAYMFLGVLVGWVFFKSENLGQAFRILGAMTSPLTRTFEMPVEPIQINPISFALCLMGIVYCFYLEPRQKVFLKNLEQPVQIKLAVTSAFALALVWILSAQVIPFLYFQF